MLLFRICKFVTIYPSLENITPEPIPLLLLEYERLLCVDDEIVTTEEIDLSAAETNLLLLSLIKYHDKATVNKITKI